MNRWQVHFLGTRKLPEDLSPFEMAYFFSFKGEMRREIMARRNACQRLGLAMHVGFLRMTGRSLDAFERIPRVLLKHLSKQLNTPSPDLASLRVLYRRPRTLYDHQEWAIRKLGLKSFTSQRAGALLRHVREEAQRTITPSDLLLFSRCWLYDNAILIPAERRLMDTCRRAQREAEQALLSRIDAQVPEAKRLQWMSALAEPR